MVDGALEKYLLGDMEKASMTVSYDEQLIERWPSRLRGHQKYLPTLSHPRNTVVIFVVTVPHLIATDVKNLSFCLRRTILYD